MSALYPTCGHLTGAFAIYRLPYEDHATLIRQNEGEPVELFSCQELNGRQGFVVAPFQVTTFQPILLIHPDEVESVECRIGDAGQLDYPKTQQHSQQGTYAIDYANYHAQLKLGTFRKIVLARCAEEETVQPIDPMELFLRACERYPRMFIALVSTAKSGCWLTATPEILLQSEGDRWRTIALAGTMKLRDEQLNSEGETVAWSTKNIQEQRIVSTYITECLEQFTADFQEEGPRTVRAANLVHLRSDFTFSLPDNALLGDLLHTLHPTPAVCGLPKREAFDFIVHNEHTPRRYYSGFMGPIGAETHLYVSLRCMNIEGCHYHLYAGGGLLKDSTEEQEWQETEAKLETMRNLLMHK
jgi:isochorismate synthase